MVLFNSDRAGVLLLNRRGVGCFGREVLPEAEHRSGRRRLGNSANRLCRDLDPELRVSKRLFRMEKFGGPN